MSNKNKLKFLIPLLILVLTFLLKGTVADFAEKRVKNIVDFVPFETMMSITAQNEPSIQILKNGQFAFDPERILLGAEPAKLAKYFQTIGKMNDLKTAYAKKNGGSKKYIAGQKNTNKSVARSTSKGPQYDITSVYLGRNMNYIMLDGILLKTGDSTPQGEKITLITKTKIEVRGKWGERWITVN